MTGSQWRKMERQHDALVKSCAPKLKAEPTPAPKPVRTLEPQRVYPNNIRRTFSF